MSGMDVATDTAGGAAAGGSLGGLLSSFGGPWGLAAGGVLGLLSGILGNKAQQETTKKQTQMAAATTAFSPWTHMQPQMPTPTSTTGNILGGLGAGLSTAQGVGNAMNTQALLSKILAGQNKGQ